jgi:sulfur carrier protein ThiS
MGLSSSQARLLNLTARMHQIEYKAAKLEAEKLQMANESDRVYEDYLEALEKTKIQHKVLTTDGSTTYKDIANYAEFTAAGYAIQYNGKVYTGSDQTIKAAATGATTYTFGNLLNDLGISSTSGNFETLLTNIINSGQVTLVSAKSDGSFAKATDSDFDLYETSVSTNTGLQEVTDESLLKKAEAKYEADMKKIDKKDSKYDSDLAALDTERTAIKDEMDTLKTVAKDNVERTFKIFS